MEFKIMDAEADGMLDALGLRNQRAAELRYLAGKITIQGFRDDERKVLIAQKLAHEAATIEEFYYLLIGMESHVKALGKERIRIALSLNKERTCEQLLGFVEEDWQKYKNT